MWLWAVWFWCDDTLTFALGLPRASLLDCFFELALRAKELCCPYALTSEGTKPPLRLTLLFHWTCGGVAKMTREQTHNHLCIAEIHG